MKDLNSCIFTGRLTRDPELRTTAGGTDVLAFSLAVNDARKTDGGWEDKPNFLDFKMFGKSASTLANLLTKGMKVTVESRADWSKFDGKDGKPRTKVEFLVRELVLPSRETVRDDEGSSLYDADLPF